ncbi:MAG: CpaF family protein [Chloroflexota bacterium]|nr:CpaF family protein [Chloroflexota bacterium]
MPLFRNHSPSPANGRNSKPQAAPQPSSPPPASNAPAHAPNPPKPADPAPEKAPYAPPPGFRKVREDVQQFLANEIKSLIDVSDSAEVRRLAEPVFTKALEDAQLVVSRVEREQMMAMIMADILGYGPIQPLLDRDDISEVMVNGPNQVYIEQRGKLTLSNVKFVDNDHILRVIERIVTPLGRRIDESSPMVDARLPDGSRVNAIIPPLSLVGPVITIRKFNKDPLKIDDLIRFGSMTPEFAEFVRAAVVAGANVIISGGTGSGKTTLLNVLSSFIPENERILTIEDAAELQLQQPHCVRLEARPANNEGKGRIAIRDLVVNALRMRPDRIVVGECRGGEALDMLQAMNTGHDGSLTTIHSNSARDTLNRIETMVLMAGMELPLRAIRQQIASAIDLIVHQSRLRDGSRKVVQASEVVGMEGDTIVMQDVFRFEQTGIDENGKILGELLPTGLRPRINDRIEDAGIHLPPSVFGLNEGTAWYKME